MHDLLIDTIPVLDLAGSFSPDLRERRAVAAELHAIARSTGVFYAQHHGVPDAAIAAHLALARAFFALDVTEKAEIDVASSNCFRGYEAFASQTIDAAAPGDLKEGFIMGPDLAPDHPHVLAKYPNTGSNLWPRRPAGFREAMLAWVERMNALGRRLAGCLALSLDLDEDYFAPGLVEPLTYSQLFHYPPQRTPDDGISFGAGAHVDWGLLTILLQDDVGGLEVRTADGRWIAMPPRAGTFVIILGELVVRLTNGLYRSATHRVAANTSGRSRYSMPTFFDPAYDYEIGCVPTCVPATRGPSLSPCTVAAHMIGMARRDYQAS